VRDFDSLLSWIYQRTKVNQEDIVAKTRGEVIQVDNSKPDRNVRYGDSKMHPAHASPGREDGFEPLLDSTEAAALLKIHPKTLQKLARNGEVAAIQIGKLWRFRASALDEWIKRILS
jgi:excisionase family DNA binding protein